MKLAVGVMGSASGAFSASTLESLRDLGGAIAERNCVFVTGACPGLSYERRSCTTTIPSGCSTA